MFVITIAYSVINIISTGETFYEIMDDSMSPTIMKGEVVEVGEWVDFKKNYDGDIIVVYSTENKDQVTAQRIIETTSYLPWTFLVRGDNETNPDTTGRMIIEEDYVGAVFKIYENMDVAKLGGEFRNP